MLELDHYLEVLVIKPGALAGASALVEARRGGSFSETHQRFWDHARRSLRRPGGEQGPYRGLLLHRTMTRRRGERRHGARYRRWGRSIPR